MRASTLPLAGLVAGAAGLGWSLVEANAFTLRRLSIPVLPPGSTPLRVLHVSDLHLVPYQRRKLDWVRGLAALEPDLVVSTGDNLAHPDAVPHVLAAHRELLARPGVFVLGSNDYYGPRFKSPARYLLPEGGKRRIKGARLPTEQLVAGFVGAGWLDLNNHREQLKVGEHVLEFVGVDDPHLQRDRYSQVAGPADPAAALTIGVLHAPYQRVLDVMAADGASLLLAGHTHGGQLCLPGYGALVTNCDLDRKRAKGVSRWPAGGGADAGAAAGAGVGVGAVRAAGAAADAGKPRDDAWLHVSAGLGTSPFTPVRFACRPEATLLTLEPKAP